MADIFLKQYNLADYSNAFNAAHKYRFAKMMRMDTSLHEMSWQRGKKEVLAMLIRKITENLDTTNPFGFATAPSNTKIFVNDIESCIVNSFSNGINISSCFSKINGFNAGKTKVLLSEDQLRSSMNLNKECFNSLLSDDINTILLLDDVFSLGNTFNAMKLLINDIDRTKKIITAAILRTT